MRAPLFRLAIGLPIGLLACIALLVYFLIQSRRPVPQGGKRVAHSADGARPGIPDREALDLLDRDSPW